MDTMVTIFNSIFKTDTPFHVDIQYVLDLITSGKNKVIINKIRKTQDKTKRNELKKQLKGICFSGRFSKRNEKSIISHSGLVCLDYDDVKDLDKLKKELSKNPYVYCFFLSPSGNGLKVLIKVPASIEDHKGYYMSICDAFNFEGIDEATRDLSRVCFESYDPNLFLNKESKVWEEKKEFEIVTYTEELPKYFQITDKGKKLDIILGWFDKRFTFVKGEMNNNLCKLATALNKVGIEKTEAKILVLDKYPNLDLSEKKVNEIFNWAYEKVEDFNKFIVKDTIKILEAKALKPEKLKRKMLEQGFSENDIEDVNEFDFKKIKADFWTVGNKNKIKIDSYLFRLFLENNGFYRFRINEEECTFVRLQDNVLTDLVGAKKDYIKDFVLKYLVENNQIDVYNIMADNPKYFKIDYINQLEIVDLPILKDTRDISYVYFKNGCVKVTEKGTEIIEYIDCTGLVWDVQIMNKNYIPLDDPKTDYKTFIYNICNNDPQRIKAMESTIGYLLHRYKKKSEAYAVIIYDETTSADPEGGTGKTIIIDSLKQVRAVATEDGKSWNSKDNFAYQNVNQSHDIFCVDDLKKNYDFENLFSITSNDMTVNKKNKQPVVIPFSESPKLYMTSNYILQGNGTSHNRRKIELELYRHYREEFTPSDEFGRMLFIDWKDDDFNSFYNYMIGCLQKYMVEGITKIPLITGKLRKLTESTNNSFVTFMENNVLWSKTTLYNSTELMNLFREDINNEVPKSMNSSSFGSWVNHFLKFKGWEKINEKRVRERGLCYNINFKNKEPDTYEKKTDIFEGNDNKLF